jgi:hypothetical protein
MVQDVWQNIVSEIPTHFGRLVYLASLRDENKGTYWHPALEKYGDPEECDQILAQSHRVVFYDWLALRLAEQCQDMVAYLQDVQGQPGTVLGTWKKIEPFGRYLPLEYGAGDRELFLTDLRTLVDLLISDETLYRLRTS